MRGGLHLVLIIIIAACSHGAMTMAHEETHQYVASQYGCDSSNILVNSQGARVLTDCTMQDDKTQDQHYQTQMYTDAVWHQLNTPLLILSLLTGIIISWFTEHLATGGKQ